MEDIIAKHKYTSEKSPGSIAISKTYISFGEFGPQRRLKSKTSFSWYGVKTITIEPVGRIRLFSKVRSRLILEFDETRPHIDKHPNPLSEFDLSVDDLAKFLEGALIDLRIPYEKSSKYKYALPDYYKSLNSF